MTDADTPMSEERLRCREDEDLPILRSKDETAALVIARAELCHEVRRLKAKAATHEADAAAMRAELEQHEYCDCTHEIGGACRACCHRETDDAPHADDCPWKAALDGSAGRELLEFALFAANNGWQREASCMLGPVGWLYRDGEADVPAWLPQAADGGGK